MASPWGVLQSAANLSITMLAGGKHTSIPLSAKLTDVGKNVANLELPVFTSSVTAYAVPPSPKGKVFIPSPLGRGDRVSGG